MVLKNTTYCKNKNSGPCKTKIWQKVGQKYESVPMAFFDVIYFCKYVAASTREFQLEFQDFYFIRKNMILI